jgi:hypothetical protein
LDATWQRGRANGSWWLNTEKPGNFAVPFSTHPNPLLPNNNKSGGKMTKIKIIKKLKKEREKNTLKKKWLNSSSYFPKSRGLFDITL